MTDAAHPLLAEPVCVCSAYGPEPDCQIHGVDAYDEELYRRQLMKDLQQLRNGSDGPQLRLDSAIIEGVHRLLKYLPLLHQSITLGASAAGELVITGPDQAHLVAIVRPDARVHLLRGRPSTTFGTRADELIEPISSVETDFGLEVLLNFFGDQQLPGEITT